MGRNNKNIKGMDEEISKERKGERFFQASIKIY